MKPVKKPRKKVPLKQKAVKVDVERLFADLQSDIQLIRQEVTTMRQRRRPFDPVGSVRQPIPRIDLTLPMDMPVHF